MKDIRDQNSLCLFIEILSARSAWGTCLGPFSLWQPPQTFGPALVVSMNVRHTGGFEKTKLLLIGPGMLRATQPGHR